MTLAPETLYAVLDATWPAARFTRLGPWTLREGQGGGQRVSAATAEDAVGVGDIEIAIAAMREMGQRPLFMVRAGEAALDAQLAERGLILHDPVNAYACPAEALTDIPVPRVTALRVWEPLQIMREIWAEGGIGPGRLAVMERAPQPKTAILGRINDKPGGACFVAMHQGVAMVHAIEVLPHQRRHGMAGWFMREAAVWTLDNGGHTLSVVCTRANTAANALYASLGMASVGQYHYRRMSGEDDRT
ncbi:MAG TPA: GNAT family N-acetyltransferase [Rhodobacteraceae bacterium]|nr:GNAT family N-acetyltransferase [Paracoccaceae bacterium]